MENATFFFGLLQIVGISLGVGSSTLAVLNFFSAIKDGAIDSTERRMMGVTYIVLRVAMGIILLSTLALVALAYGSGTVPALSSYMVAQLILVTVLFVNAYLMTIRVMPSTFGPAIQAGSWYLLGFGMALASLGYQDFSLPSFFMVYVGELLFAILLINGVMSYLRSRSTATQSTHTNSTT